MQSLEPVGIIGAGPAGATLGRLLAGAGLRAVLIDEREPHEKACGGGVTARGYSGNPLLDKDLNGCVLVKEMVLTVRWEKVAASLPAPVRIYRRIDLNRILFEAALSAGVVFMKARARGIEPLGSGFRIDFAGAPPLDVGFLAGADGAAGISRKILGGGRGRRKFVLAHGFHAEREPGDESLFISFPPGLPGYAWIFPRPGHSAVGICSRDHRIAAKALADLLQKTLREAGREPSPIPGTEYAFPIPDFTAFEGPRCGHRWALIGDAGGFVDPITLEGIPYAIRSAEVLAGVIAKGEPQSFEESWRADFGKELFRSAGLVERFYRDDFPASVVRWAASSSRIREIVAGLMCGADPYAGLRLRVARAFFADRAEAFLRRLRRRRGADRSGRLERYNA